MRNAVIASMAVVLLVAFPASAVDVDAGEEPGRTEELADAEEGLRSTDCTIFLHDPTKPGISEDCKDPAHWYDVPTVEAFGCEVDVNDPLGPSVACPRPGVPVTFDPPPTEDEGESVASA